MSSFSLVMSRSLPEIDADRSTRSPAACRSWARTSPTVLGLPVAILLIALWIVKYSLSVGEHANRRHSQRKPMTMAQNSSPIKLTPRCAAALKPPR